MTKTDIASDSATYGKMKPGRVDQPQVLLSLVDGDHRRDARREEHRRHQQGKDDDIARHLQEDQA